MENLVKKLNEAAKAYYSGHESTMSDKEYDELYAELQRMEQETGVVLPDSPTHRVGYEVVSELLKVKHEYPALSLDKTKDREELKKWLGEHIGILSWKLDGLTAVATYDNGSLVSLVTRGNGAIGEDVTHNAPYIKGLPMTIPYDGHLVVRGETLISYPDFDKINVSIEDPDEKYKNPRNLASSSLRLMDSSIASKRHMSFQAFEVVYPEMNTVSNALEWLETLRIDHVAFQKVNAQTLFRMIELDEQCIQENLLDEPTDGLVLTYDDSVYGRALGTTGKFPKHSIAFKWQDDTVETTIRNIEWSASRTGLISPVAVFDPVELEGTTVTKASVHNIQYMKGLELGKDDIITIYKANKIIPQIDENLTKKGNYFEVPDCCPVCGEPTVRKFNKEHTSEFLYCMNAECPAKHVGKYTRLVERDALNVKGLSSAKIEQFVNLGYLKEFADLFHMERYKKELLSMEGFGEKSYQNMIDAIEASRTTTFRQLFYALGIPGAGHDVAKILESHLTEPKAEQLLSLTRRRDAYVVLTSYEGIGDVTADVIIQWFWWHADEYQRLCQELTVMEETSTNKQDLAGKIFVITGKLESYRNRDALKAEIEARGGKVAGSVSKNTSYLINNDVTSTSGKNKKAKELGVAILSEEDFKKLS